MIVLRLSAVFIFAALLSGCDQNVKELKEDVRALKEDIAEFKKDIKDFKERVVPVIRAYFAQLPKPPSCKAPGQHSERPCLYKLKILKTPASSNAPYQGQVPHVVVETENADCKNNHPFPSRCPMSGDEDPHEFFIDPPVKDPTKKEKDAPPVTLKIGDMVICESETQHDHLKNCVLETT